MLTAEHREVAIEFLAASDAEFERGDVLQGAEKLWGAAAHAVMSAALARGWDHSSHRALKNAVVRLSENYADPLARQGFMAGFLAAEKFHRHFYHDSMEDWERDIDGPLVHDFVRRVLEVA